VGTLFLVSTPIGNLQDITLRAIKVLKTVDIIACEDTRKTGLLLKKILNSQFSKKPRLLSCFEGNEEKRIPQIISSLKKSENVALISSAGTPTISDPGFKLVRECIKEKIRIETIPGASAILTALVSSGFPTDKFLFLGYLPKKKGKRQAILKNLILIFQVIRVTAILFEAPHRLLPTLEEMKKVLGDIDIVICRELTKLHEEIKRGKITNLIKHYTEKAPRGEITILFRLETKF
jgi:16S rRNA (cytidine1402-2'-O)-methyltransferase